MWEQLNLTYDYGVDRLWVLNVGDLKPMEYPITLFLDMAWNPKRYDAAGILRHTEDFCRQQFGETQAAEAARIINLYSKYNGRVTAEMLDADTYDLPSGEWKRVADDYARLEAEALRQFLTLRPEQRDAYRQLILFLVQAMANLYEMYYSQAMNRHLFDNGDPDADLWADAVERCFRRDRELERQYNKEMSAGKWDGMMTQKHIGYKEWHDGFKEDTMPEVRRIGVSAPGGFTFSPSASGVVMEAEHYHDATTGTSTSWTVYPHMGRTRSGVALTPYTERPAGERISYRFEYPQMPDSVDVRVVVKSTLAFANPEGHSFSVGFEGEEPVTVNFNSDLNEKPENIYSVFYPTVARRVVSKNVRLRKPASASGDVHTLSLRPLDPGIVFEKIIVGPAALSDEYLFGTESECGKVR